MKTITDRQQEILDLFLVHGNKRKVARELGINESSVRYALRAAEAKGLAPWLSPVAIPDHLSLSKTTVQYNKDGEVIQEWKRLIPMAQNMEDFVTWVDSSKVRRTVQKYNDKLDDFDLL